MAYDDLREFIKVLEKHKELKRITTPVSSDQEITEITDRVSKAGGPALLFENVDDGKIPVLINALGSRRRMALALEVNEVEQVAGRLTVRMNVDESRCHDMAGNVNDLGASKRVFRDCHDFAIADPDVPDRIQSRGRCPRSLRC